MARVALICQLISGVISGHYKNIHLISVDEKSGIQALSRKVVSMSKGKLERREYEYKRNLSLIHI